MNRVDTAKFVVPQNGSIRDAVAAIDRGGRQVAVVLDDTGRLVATVTDGDVRRGLLRGVTLNDLVIEVMHMNPVTARQSDRTEVVRQLMTTKNLHHIPIIDDAGHLVNIAWIDDLAAVTAQDTRVVLMAGGLGERLRPLTDTIPKPMLPVGGRPLLDLIVNNFLDQGFRRFTISLNYLGHIVRDHFGDGTSLGAEIDYLEETTRLGTAGALSLLGEPPAAPIVVMNGDVLTSVRFEALLRFHADTGAAATMCARKYSSQVPYGVISTNGSYLLGVEEKPTHNYLVNAGIYVLSPESLKHLEVGQPLDMPQLFEKLLAAEQQASVYPIDNYWLDIGKMEDLERARVAAQSMFGR